MPRNRCGRGIVGIASGSGGPRARYRHVTRSASKSPGRSRSAGPPLRATRAPKSFHPRGPRGGGPTRLERPSSRSGSASSRPWSTSSRRRCSRRPRRRGRRRRRDRPTAMPPRTSATRPPRSPRRDRAARGAGTVAPPESRPLGSVRHPGHAREEEGQRRFRPGLRDPVGRRRVHLPVPQPHPVRLPRLRAVRPGAPSRTASCSPGSGSCSAAGSPSRSATSSRWPTASTPSRCSTSSSTSISIPGSASASGRFKTPFTYEFFVEPVQGLILPERSIFFNNFGQNRDLGIMAFGRLFNNTFDYATGIFNGNRNGYIAASDCEVHLVVHQLEAVQQLGRARSSRTSTSAARSSAATRHQLPVPHDPPDHRADGRQRGRRRAVPRLQQQRAASRGC